MNKWTPRVIAVACWLAVPSLPVVAQSSKPPSTFRVLQWNVSDSAWVKKFDSSRAVLRYADPDVFMLVSISASMDGSSIRQALSGLRGPADTTWFVTSLPAESGLEHTAIASRYRITAIPEFSVVPYGTQGKLAGLATMPVTNPPAEPAAKAGPNTHTAGALVTVGRKRVLVVAIHLTCCGSAGTWREYRRQLGAIAIRDHTRAAITRHLPDAVIIAGDMNLVSGRAALDTLLMTAVKPRLGPMRRAEALQADGWSDWTWDGRDTQFNAGRLDNMIYSAGTLAVVKALIWDTEAMPTDSLSAHGLQPGTSRAINHHRPVVVDFRFH